MYHSKIAGLGYYVPENVVTNEDLSKIIDTNDEWIQERTGIQERRHIIKGEDTTTSMGVKAAEIAIERAGIARLVKALIWLTRKIRAKRSNFLQIHSNSFWGQASILLA